MSVLTFAQQIDDAFKAADITTPEMSLAIEDWYNLYFATNTPADEDPAQRIPYTIVRKLTKTAFAEYATSTKDEFARGIMDGLGKIRKKAMQSALIGGVALVKPIPTKAGFRFNVIPRNHIRVYGRADDGSLTDIATAERSTEGKYFYTLVERRTVDQNGYLRIQNRLFKSMDTTNLGTPASLKELPKYELLKDEYIFTEPVHSIGLAPLAVPIQNCVDGSEDAVSVYAACAGKIHTVNVNEAQINGEFEKGKMRIIASADYLKRDPTTGKKKIVDDVFTGIDDDPDSVGFTPFAPSFRDASYLARNTEALRECESIIGLKRGLLADVQEVERTATEITSSDGDFNLTIIDFQEAWEECADEVLRLCAYFGKKYQIPGAHDITEDTVVYDWGNGVLYDREKKWQELQDMVARDELKAEIAVGWYFGMETETEVQLAKVRKRYMPEIDKMLEGEE